ncbi:hypothetical protein R6U77_00895 [Lysinibacillus louembei]|uniref:DUF2187 domain-containing protein n=1 Tax=Lysinibacillus louembei TaxID=1470088 RepID=A0ABZ0RZ44_9BACI|nr:hypothetical protein [Lysinibacillus louembei]WPK12276.1 hypothetical protein R6U77_00895 [Lysinibacillus louembei]
MEIKTRDTVKILNSDGQEIAIGTVANINEFREPDLKYAVSIEGYSGFVFVGKNQLQKVEAI